MTLKRRIIVFLIAGLVLAAVAAVYYMPHWQQTVAAVSKGGRRGGPPASEPVPVLATAARAADVPVYLDGVGTAKALNTVTVRSQVDGKIINISFTEGQDVPAGFVLAKIDPVTYQAAFDQTVAKKAQDEAQLANARLDLDRYTRLAATNSVKAAARYPEGAGQSARGADQARPGGDRQRTRYFVLHRHRRADRRPHWYPSGRCRQSRARGGG